MVAIVGCPCSREGARAGEMALCAMQIPWRSYYLLPTAKVASPRHPNYGAHKIQILSVCKLFGNNFVNLR